MLLRPRGSPAIPAAQVEQIALEHGVGQPPIATAAAFDDGSVTKLFQRAPDGASRQVAVDRVRARDAAGELEAQPVGLPDALDGLLVACSISRECREVALLDQARVDLTCVQEHRREVGLLSDQHRGPGVELAELDKASQRAVGDATVICGEALAQAG
jgi:hypothetical protein